MPLPRRVKTTKSKPAPVSERDGYSDHIDFTSEGACPTSSDRKHRHRAKAHARITVTTHWSGGSVSRSYEDLCRCQFCGHEWTQEWMGAGF